ncbi:MAG: type II toxin-antitoxin system RelE/ParE family toxin [Pseudomonadales bacterium]|nr:type II toxin-antitoxin system RelE/ParE family toxin [Pseudomonadales bacterium]
MAQVTWTEPALNDLNELAEYIALSNVIAAKELVQEVLDKVDRLEQHPKSGRVPPELKSLNYREVIVNPCRVFYKIEKQKIYILFIMRQERDLKKFLINKQQG